MNYEYTEAENREMAWFRALPKAELHCHLDGSLPRHTVRRLGKEAGLALPETEEALAAALTDCSGRLPKLKGVFRLLFPAHLLPSDLRRSLHSGLRYGEGCL